MATVRTGFEVPTWAVLRDRCHDDLTLRLGQDSRIAYTWPWALARMTAGLSYALHGLLATASRYAIVDRAPEDGVRRHGRVLGMAQVPASRAAGTLVFGGTNGTEIPEGTRVRLNTSGQEYDTTADGTIAAGTATIAAQAVLAGDDGNASGGVYGALVTTIEGVNAVVTVGTAMSGGADDETAADYLARVLDRYRRPPHGGAAHDYEAWAKAALPSVDAVWVVKGAVPAGPPWTSRPVTVYFTLDGTGVAIVPNAGHVATVQAYIDTIAPDLADVTVATPEGAPPPTGRPVNLEITSATATAAQKTAVETALHALFARKNRERQPDTHPDLLPPGVAVGEVTCWNSEIRNAIGSALEAYTLTDVDSDGTGLSNVACAANYACYLAGVVWLP